MAIHHLFIDEHGTVGSDVDDEPYGYGFYLGPEGPEKDDLEAAIQRAFPQGFHLSRIRGTRRKLTESTRLLGLLPASEGFYGGGFVQTDPAYARRKFYHNLSGRGSDASEPSAELMQAVLDAQPTGGRIVDPNDIACGAKEVGRLLAIYSHALRTPLMALMRSAASPREIELRIHLGVVGREDRYKEQVRKIAPSLRTNLQNTLDRFVQAGAIPQQPRSLDVDLVRAGESLFDVADLFGGVAVHHYRYSQDDRYALGEDLYTAAKPYLDRLPVSAGGRSLVHGIVVM